VKSSNHIKGLECGRSWVQYLVGSNQRLCSFKE